MALNFAIHVLVLFPPAHADYRAHEIAIINSETGAERRVISSLDHLQYSFYYPLARGEETRLVTSWHCRGRTGSWRRICPAPTAQQKANSSP